MGETVGTIQLHSTPDPGFLGHQDVDALLTGPKPTFGFYYSMRFVRYVSWA
jgi:hypothetical protein